MSGRLASALLAECERRLLDEGQPRLIKCLDMLSEEQVWHRPNETSNSVGNLVLHLCGNVRQWLLSGLGGAPDERRRATEFEDRGTLTGPQLAELLDLTMREARAVLRDLGERDLVRTYRVQGFEESGVAILVHVVEHFSYHVGQATYVVKSLTDRDTGYYAGLDLERKG